MTKSGKTPRCTHNRVVRTPRGIITGKLRPSGEIITGESFWTPRGHFTDSDEHKTIFKGIILLKSDCGSQFYI
jgi:hypothetical protein